jgi:hypothetical protein
MVYLERNPGHRFGHFKGGIAVSIEANVVGVELRHYRDIRVPQGYRANWDTA